MPQAKGTPASAGVLLSRDEILAAQDLAAETVDVPEWGGAVKVRGLSGGARDSLEARFTDEKGRLDRDRFGRFRAAVAAASIVGPDGSLLFSDADIEALAEKSSAALGRVFDVAMRLSAARPEDIDGLVEDLKDDPSGVTGSD